MQFSHLMRYQSINPSGITYMIHFKQIYRPETNLLFKFCDSVSPDETNQSLLNRNQFIESLSVDSKVRLIYKATLKNSLIPQTDRRLSFLQLTKLILIKYITVDQISILTHAAVAQIPIVQCVGFNPAESPMKLTIFP